MPASWVLEPVAGGAKSIALLDGVPVVLGRNPVGTAQEKGEGGVDSGHLLSTQSTCSSHPPIASLCLVLCS